MADINYVGGETRIVVFEELEDLDEIVERGPDWNTIEEIVIRLNRPSCLPNKSAS
ncbi:hypothetical protein DYI24_00405 [Rhodopseudomonas sp. BR0C11]|uniref:hypothetical protein n=1 Tax=Rhodopseudomonas sp. BR0C11 TaxID=2269370 RepID=UPI0013DFFC66|nr:hypothetical protein [Rhodopseudomonas sp. BR0C11]NEV75542.1 hypothetical protein [Rhodopseudomonas sp. BR0C11]